MRYSQLFPKTLREAPKSAITANHKFLVRAGFVDQLMAGSWTLLPMGWRVVGKINQIIREEMNNIGGQEMLMPLLHPKEIWNQTGRWEAADEVMYKLKDTRGKEYALSFTHEEIVMDLVKKFVHSYKDLPLAVYHFSTKFRNEPRARSGILRGREFMMKDLYSAHTDEKDLMDYYEITKKAYVKIFKRLGFTNCKVVEASGGVFTDKHTHEFQVLADTGEDTIFYCNSCDFAQNHEIFEGKAGVTCPDCKKGKILESRAIEVGNIFPLKDKFSKAFGLTYKDKKGEDKFAQMGCYGIGISRLMGAIVEVYNDDKGIIWPKTVSPFNVHLVHIEDPGTEPWAKDTYEKLTKAGIEVLWDNREDVTAGEKFADCDLIGIPARLVVSGKTGKGKVELKMRSEKQTRVGSVDNVIKSLSV